MSVSAQAVVDEALSWVGTPFAHQQMLKGVAVDCANYLAGVAGNTGAVPDVDFERRYRRHEDGRVMLAELMKYMVHVDEGEPLKPADVVAFHDGRKRDEPRHLAFVTRLEPYVKVAHASERGVRHHRLDAHFKSMIHSVWRIPGLSYD